MLFLSIFQIKDLELLKQVTWIFTLEIISDYQKGKYIIRYNPVPTQT